MLPVHASQEQELLQHQTNQWRKDAPMTRRSCMPLCKLPACTESVLLHSVLPARRAPSMLVAQGSALLGLGALGHRAVLFEMVHIKRVMSAVLICC